MADSTVLTAEVVIDAMTSISLARYLSGKLKSLVALVPGDLTHVRVRAGSAATLVVYDWLLLFSDELDTIWKAKWTVPKVLYYYVGLLFFRVGLLGGMVYSSGLP